MHGKMNLSRKAKMISNMKQRLLRTTTWCSYRVPSPLSFVFRVQPYCDPQPFIPSLTNLPPPPTPTHTHPTKIHITCLFIFLGAFKSVSRYKYISSGIAKEIYIKKSKHQVICRQSIMSCKKRSYEVPSTYKS